MMSYLYINRGKEIYLISDSKNMVFLRLYLGLPGGSVVKNLPANTGATVDVSLIPGLGRYPGKGNGNPLQHSCWDNSMDRGAWWAIDSKVKKS